MEERNAQIIKVKLTSDTNLTLNLEMTSVTVKNLEKKKRLSEFFGPFMKREQREKLTLSEKFKIKKKTRGRLREK